MRLKNSPLTYKEMFSVLKQIIFDYSEKHIISQHHKASE